MQMLEKVEVCEIVWGLSSDLEKEQVHEWVSEMYRKDQASFGTRIIFMNGEDVKAMFYNTLRMAGKLRISSRNAVRWTQVESDILYEHGKDG